MWLISEVLPIMEFLPALELFRGVSRYGNEGWVFYTCVVIIGVYFLSRISGPYGPLEILAPAESLLASFTRKFGSLTCIF